MQFIIIEFRASATVHSNTMLLHCEDEVVRVGEETISPCSVNSAKRMAHC